MIRQIDDPTAIDEAVRAVAAGHVIAFPTDTVYGVGADLWQPAAVERLYAVKGRPDEKALPVLMAGEDDCRRVATRIPPSGLALMRAFWPGPLTIVLPRRDDVPDAVGPRVATIAVRVPDHDGLRRALARTGPLASSSANRSGKPPALDAPAVQAALGDGVALILDGGTPRHLEPSTVVDVSGESPRILRQGALAAAEIARILDVPAATLALP